MQHSLSFLNEQRTPLKISNGLISSSSYAEKIVYYFLQRIICQGSLTVRDSAGVSRSFGTFGSGPRVSVFIHDPRFFKRLLRHGSLGLGESYSDGWWEVEGNNLVEFFQLLFMNRAEYHLQGSILHRVKSALFAWHSAPRNRAISRLDIHVHYDLGNEFFKQMLDASMAYSCGYAKSESDTISKMQHHKYERICQKLGLERGGKLIDIGCGWGGLLLYVAQHYPSVSGEGITISQEQYDYANEKIKEAGIGDRWKVKLFDYRDIEGTFDFVVSVGMFEHVGLTQYHQFFSRLHALLNDRGIALLHTIGLEEEPSRKQDPWIEKYIFPGSRLPRLEEICKEARSASFIVGHVENLRPHYALTLQRWRENVLANWPTIQKLGSQFDARFFRTWNYYLQICEACFIDSTVELYQVLLCRREKWQFPLRFEF